MTSFVTPLRNIFQVVKRIFAITHLKHFKNILFAFVLLRYFLGGIRPR